MKNFLNQEKSKSNGNLVLFSPILVIGMLPRLFIPLIIVLFSTGIFAQNAITRDEAFKIIKQKGLVDTLENTVRVSVQIIPPNTVIKLMIDSIISPASNSWFFFIDQKPYYDWAHPCKYVFLNTTDTSLTIINGQFDAYIPTDVLLFQKNANPLPTPYFYKKKALFLK